MKVYQGYAASSGLVLGQVSRVERRTESFGTGPFNPDREQRLLDRAVKTAQAPASGWRWTTPSSWRQRCSCRATCSVCPPE